MKCTSGKYIPGGFRCGKCLACRITRSTEWATRILHELDYYQGNTFATFTYDWDHIPWCREGLTLRKWHLQLAIKRLRKALEPSKIKYFGCGEYGDQFGRPHYHVLILGLDHELHKTYKVAPFKGIAYEGPLVDIWSYGYVHIGTVTRDSIRYVTDYIKKKWVGKQDHVGDRFLGRKESPFQLSSQGFGKRYAEKNAKQLKEMLDVTVKGVHVGLPRYYRKVLEIDQYHSPEWVLRSENSAKEEIEKIVLKLDKEKQIDKRNNVWKDVGDWMAAAKRQRAATLRAKAALRPKKTF